MNAPIAVGNVAVTMLQLSNVAWEVNRELDLDTTDGKVQNDAARDEVLGPRVREGLGAASRRAAVDIIGSRTNGSITKLLSKGLAMKNTFSRRNFVQSGALVAAASVTSGAVPFRAGAAAGDWKAVADPSGRGQLHLPELHSRADDRLSEAAQRERAECKGRQGSSSDGSDGRGEGAGGLCGGGDQAACGRDDLFPEG